MRGAATRFFLEKLFIEEEALLEALVHGSFSRRFAHLSGSAVGRGSCRVTLPLTSVYVSLAPVAGGVLCDTSTCTTRALVISSARLHAVSYDVCRQRRACAVQMGRCNARHEGRMKL